jgi:hypothetical protein
MSDEAFERYVVRVLERIESKVDGLLTVTMGIRRMSTTLSTDINNVIAAVTADQTIEGSAITLINSIPSLIATAVQQALSQGASPQQLAALTTLATTIGNNATLLSQAVVANTPAAPPTTSGTSGTFSGTSGTTNGGSGTVVSGGTTNSGGTSSGTNPSSSGFSTVTSGGTANTSGGVTSGGTATGTTTS